MRPDPYRIILHPLVTEKGTAAREEGARKRYLFEVLPTATKIQIREAVEEIYKDKKVTVEKVATVRVKGKFRRVRIVGGYTSDRKKAIVTLKKGDTLDTV